MLILRSFLSLLFQCSVLCGTVRYLKQTVARILSEVAVREWPQRWAGLLPTLFAACDPSTPSQQAGQTKDPAGTELIALIIRNLAEEATSDGSAASAAIPEQRRKDLQAGLMAVMESIFPWVQGALRGAVQRFAANKADQQALRESLALLETLRALFEFLPAKWVFESNILGELCGMLSQPDLFLEIADLLQAISNRKTNTIDEKYHAQIVAVLDVVLQWMPALQPAATGADGKAAPPSFPRQREFLQKLLLVLNNCTKFHAELLTPPQYDAVRTKLLATLGQLLNHPFQKVPTHCTRCSLFIFSHASSTGFVLSLCLCLCALSFLPRRSGSSPWNCGCTCCETMRHRSSKSSTARRSSRSCSRLRAFD